MAQPSAQSNGTRSRRATKKPPDDDKVLPHNLDAEAGVLGGIIQHNDVLESLDTLEIDHFYHFQHRVVFETIRNLQAKRTPIDVLTLETASQRAGNLDALGGIAFFGELALRCPTRENVLHYARTVRELALIRNVILKAAEHADKGYRWEYEADEFLGELLADLQKLDRGHREANEKLPIITIGGALEEIDRLAATPIYETPFEELNRALGFDGLLAGQVYYLCGGTGFGKTSFIGALVKYTAMQSRPALVAFWEMFAGYYVARMAAPILGVHSNEILRARQPAGVVMRALPPMIEFLDSPSITTLKRAIERHVRAGRGAPLVVCDYIQLFANAIMAMMPRPDARLANAQASADLRQLAKETGAAVIAVSGAGRSSSKRLADVRKLPPGDLVDVAKESGQIEYDGAGVIVLSVSDEKDGDEEIATITVAKARFGEKCHIDARYNGRTGQWRELGRVQRDSSSSSSTTDGTTKPGKMPIEELITKLLKNGPVASKTALWRLTGRHKQTVLEAIDRMIEGGIIRYTSKGLALAEITTEITTGSGPVPEPPEPQQGLL